MNYEECLEYISTAYKFNKKAGTERIAILLEHMGNPHKKLKFVHVAGTNGKGSTTSFISNILMDANYKVGIYTSPFITSFTERIRINNKDIEKEAVASIISNIKDIVDDFHLKGIITPTEFDIVTATAFQYYADNNCDIVVLETGLGGKHDSTNVIETNEASIITTIGLDHMDILGTDICDIAWHKAGIIKEGSDVIVYPQEDKIVDIFETVSQEKKCKFHRVLLSDIEARYGSIEENKVVNSKFDYNKMKDLEITLLGKHQIINAAVAVETVSVLSCKGYEITEKNIRDGLLKTTWVGRLEILKRSPIFIVDGAHNTQGVDVLLDNIELYFENKSIIFIVGILSDKDYKAMLQSVAPFAKQFITVTPNNKRAVDGEQLAAYLSCYHEDVVCAETIEKAIELSMQQKCDVICAFGSLYLISEIRNHIRH